MPANPVDVAELERLLEAATGPDRELDLAVALATGCDDRITQLVARARRGLDCEPGEAWDLGDKHVLYAVWNEHCCYANGGYLLPAYTASLDASLSLVPEGWLMALKQWPDIPNAYSDDWQATLTQGAPGYGQVRSIARTGPLALAAASLKARAALDDGRAGS